MSRRADPRHTRALAGRVPVWPRVIPVKERMRSPVATIGLQAPVRDAADLMSTRKIRHLPVVDASGRLVGILTESDVLAAFEEVPRAQVTTVRPLRDVPPAGAYDYGFPEPGGGVLEPETGSPDNPGTEDPVRPPRTCR